MRDSLANQAGLGYEYSLDGATKQINGSELGADMWVALPELVGKIPLAPRRLSLHLKT